MVKSYTILEESDDKNISVPDRYTLGSPSVSINQLSTLEEYDRATLRVTAVKVKDPVSVTTGRLKQEIVVADETGHTLTLWEDDIGMISENKSYQFNRIQIHHYLGRTELTFPHFGASAEEIDDLLVVSTYDNDDVTDLHSVTIVAVNNLETTFICINCKKTLPCDLDKTITECQQCGTKQKLRNYKTSAKLFVEGMSAQQCTLKAHNEILCLIAPR